MDDANKASIIASLEKRRTQAGFGLIQTVMVLGIIGLILGGVLVGSDLLRQATLRKQMTQLSLIESGIQNFRNKYNCFPGDCLDPTIISGYTYSGNGTGYLESTWNSDENKGFWLHLKLTDMIPDDLFSHAVLAGMNTPKMKANPIGVINAYGSMTYKRNLLELGTTSVNGAFSTVEIQSIDRKVDDGFANCGIIRTSGFGSGSTTIYASDPTFPISVENKSGSTQCVVNKEYSTSATTNYCNMLYLLAYY